jgi:hypothetical protein
MTRGPKDLTARGHEIHNTIGQEQYMSYKTSGLEIKRIKRIEITIEGNV